MESQCLNLTAGFYPFGTGVIAPVAVSNTTEIGGLVCGANAPLQQWSTNKLHSQNEPRCEDFKLRLPWPTSHGAETWPPSGMEAPPTRPQATSCASGCFSVWTPCTQRTSGCGNSRRTDSCSPLSTKNIPKWERVRKCEENVDQSDIKWNLRDHIPICTCSTWLRDTNADVSSTHDTWMLPEVQRARHRLFSSTHNFVPYLLKCLAHSPKTWKFYSEMTQNAPPGIQIKDLLVVRSQCYSFTVSAQSAQSIQKGNPGIQSGGLSSLNQHGGRCIDNQTLNWFYTSARNEQRVWRYQRHWRAGTSHWSSTL